VVNDLDYDYMPSSDDFKNNADNKKSLQKYTEKVCLF